MNPGIVGWQHNNIERVETMGDGTKCRECGVELSVNARQTRYKDYRAGWITGATGRKAVQLERTTFGIWVQKGWEDGHDAFDSAMRVACEDLGLYSKCTFAPPDIPDQVVAEPEEEGVSRVILSLTPAIMEKVENQLGEDESGDIDIEKVLQRALDLYGLAIRSKRVGGRVVLDMGDCDGQEILLD